MPNGGKYGERVSTGFVESTVNTVVGKRFGKKQQMRWSKQGSSHAANPDPYAMNPQDEI